MSVYMSGTCGCSSSPVVVSRSAWRDVFEIRWRWWTWLLTILMLLVTAGGWFVVMGVWFFLRLLLASIIPSWRCECCRAEIHPSRLIPPTNV